MQVRNILRPKNSRKCGTLSEVREKNALAAMINTDCGRGMFRTCMAARGQTHHRQVQIGQLRGLDGGWCLGHQIGAALCLGERNYLANALPPEHQNDEPIHSQRNASVRRGTKSKRIEEKRKFLLRLFG